MNSVRALTRTHSEKEPHTNYHFSLLAIAFTVAKRLEMKKKVPFSNLLSKNMCVIWQRKRGGKRMVHVPLSMLKEGTKLSTQHRTFTSHMIPLIEVNIIIKDKNVVEWRSWQLKCIIPLIYSELSTCSVLSSFVSFNVSRCAQSRCLFGKLVSASHTRVFNVYMQCMCERMRESVRNDRKCKPLTTARFWLIQMKNHFELRWLRCIYWYCCGFC